MQRRRFILRLSIVLGILAGFAAVVCGAYYLTTPKLSYRLAHFSCSKSAVAARDLNMKGPAEDACIIEIVVQNGENTPQTINYDSSAFNRTGRSLIRIYDNHDNFCDGVDTVTANLVRLKAHGSALLKLACLNTRGTDPHIDAHPIYVTLDYKASHAKVTLSQQPSDTVW